jgi:hypothetical protein
MNSRNITLEMSNGGHGQLLTECVRAYLHTGNPSSLLNRIVLGVVEYQSQNPFLSSEDRKVLGEVQHALYSLQHKISLLEDKVYSSEV